MELFKQCAENLIQAEVAEGEKENRRETKKLDKNEK